MTRYDDTWWERNVDAVAYCSRNNTLTFKDRERIAEFLISKCKTEAGVFPISRSLLTLISNVYNACPLTFIMRDQQRKFIFDLRSYSYLLMLEFIVKYNVSAKDTTISQPEDKVVKEEATNLKQDLPLRYTYDVQLESDFPQIVDSTVPEWRFEFFNSSKGKEKFFFTVQQSVHKYLAEKILRFNEISIFSQRAFKSVFHYIVKRYQSFPIDNVSNGVRQRIVISDNGVASLGEMLPSKTTKKRKANEALED